MSTQAFQSDRFKQLLKKSSSISVYHNYNEQKLRINQENGNETSIQPLSKLLNLNLQRQLNDASPTPLSKNSQNTIKKIFSTVSASDIKNQQKPDLHNNQHGQQIYPVQFIKKNFQNGTYFGQMNTQYPHGEGGFFWDNGCFYYGQWRDGMMHGCGLFIFKTGSLLRGNFKKGKANGLAELSFFSSYQQHILNGFWIEGQFQGSSPAQFYQNGLTQSFEKKVSTESSDQHPNAMGIFLERENESSQKQFEVNPYYYDTELKKKLQNYVACESSIEVGERKNCMLNGLAIRFYFDGKIEFGNFKKGLLEGRGKILFKSGDIYDGYFINSIFQGPGVYFNNQDRVWAYGAFSKNKIMYLQQQNNSYPPPALYDLRQKDEYVDQSDRLIGENQMRDRNKILDQVLAENMLRKANGEYVKSEQTQGQTGQTAQTEIDFELITSQALNSPYQVLRESKEEIPNGISPIPQNHNEIAIQLGLRKTAEFGNTIKNLSSLFQTNVQHENIEVKEVFTSEDNFSYEGERKSLQEKIIEKQLDMEDDQSYPTFYQSQPSQQLHTHQTVIGFTPRSQNHQSARHLTSLNAEGQIGNFMSDNLSSQQTEDLSQKYYGISQETYKIIQELEKSDNLIKNKDKSCEKINKLKTLITDYLNKPAPNTIITTPNNKNYNVQTPSSRNNSKQTLKSRPPSKVNNENTNPLMKKSGTLASSSTRNLFSGSMSTQNKGKCLSREQQVKQQNPSFFNYSNKKPSSYNSHSCLNIVANTNSSKSPLRLMETNAQQRAQGGEKDHYAQQMSLEKLNRVSMSSSKSSSQQQQNNQKLRQVNKSQLRIKNYSQQYEPNSLMRAFVIAEEKSRTNNYNPQHHYVQSESTPVSTPHNNHNKYSNFSNIQNIQNNQNNQQNNPTTTNNPDVQKQFYFTQSCRNHKRHVSSINFSSSNISHNLAKQTVNGGNGTQIQPKRSQYPLSIQIY